MMSRARVRQAATSCAVVLLMLVGGACGSRVTVTPEAPASFDEKVGWILRLESQRILHDPPEPSPEVIGEGNSPSLPEVVAPRPDLLALVGDPEPQLRRRAALAIGRVGLAEGVASLITALADPEVEVRQMAAFGLGLIGHPASSSALLEALNDPMPLVQGRAAEALGRIGAVEGADAIGEVARRHLAAATAMDPNDTEYPFPASAEAFRLAVYALGELRAFDALAAVVLEENGQPVLWWWPIAYALQQTGDARAVEALTTLAGVPADVVVALAARGLGELGSADPAARSALIGLLNEAEPRDDAVVIAAVRALARFDDSQSARALRGLALRRDATQAQRIAALESLAEQSTASASDLLVELISSRSPAMRSVAVRGLAKSDPETFLLVLSTLEPDADWRVRAARAEGLAHVDPVAGEYQLKLMLSAEEDPRVLPFVLQSLAVHDVSDLVDILTQYLHHQDVVVRRTAAELLGRAGAVAAGSEVTEALVAAYHAAAGDSSHLARAAIVDALAVRPDAEARTVLELALEDPEWPVRLRAERHLTSLGADLSLLAHARPAPGRRGVDFTSPDLVRPSVSPHVYIETVHGTIELELAVIDAPLAVDNFSSLVHRGFYDGLAFVRMTRMAMVQAGDPRGDGTGGAGYTVRDEVGQRPFLRGSVGLVTEGADTGGSQFFITQSPQPQLDGQYTMFARVVAGMDVVDQLATGDEIERAWVWNGGTPPQ